MMFGLLPSFERLGYNVWGLRTASGIPAILLLLGFLYYASVQVLGIMAGIVCSWAGWEFGRMVRSKGGVPLRAELMLCWGGLFAIGAWLGGTGGLNAMLLLGMLQLVLLSIYVPASTNVEIARVNSVVWGFSGLAFVIWPLAHLLLLLGFYGKGPLLLLLLVVSGNDTVAFFVGKQWGKRPLIPTVSPGKTWEGAIGGLLGGVMAATLTFLIFQYWPVFRFQLSSWWSVLWFGSLLSITAQAGDLIISYIKRQCGMKDSGRFLPGHGGLLDRIDGWLLSVPLVYYALWAELI